MEQLWEAFIDHLERGEHERETKGWRGVLRYFLNRLAHLNPELGDGAKVIVEGWTMGIINLDSIR